MKRLAFSLVCILMLLDSTQAFAWGAKGHDIVAAIAEQHLTPKAKRKINKLLDGHSLRWRFFRDVWIHTRRIRPYVNRIRSKIKK